MNISFDANQYDFDFDLEFCHFFRSRRLQTFSYGTSAFYFWITLEDSDVVTSLFFFKRSPSYNILAEMSEQVFFILQQNKCCKKNKLNPIYLLTQNYLTMQPRDPTQTNSSALPITTQKRQRGYFSDFVYQRYTSITTLSLVLVLLIKPQAAPQNLIPRYHIHCF